MACATNRAGHQKLPNTAFADGGKRCFSLGHSVSHARPLLRGKRPQRRPLPARLRYTPATPHRWRTRMTLSPFHLAIPVHDLAAARRFYGEVFGCAEGRSSEHWVDFDFFGRQLVIDEHPLPPILEQPPATAED